ncbi:hypothetical protein L1887_62129 [Cichorium endivia]|nr:hypothetical protein L1887_62129 [Cichorium endivia]
MQAGSAAPEARFGRRCMQAVAGGGSGWMRCECADANSESETRRCGHHTTVAAVVQTWTRERGMGAGLLYRLERPPPPLGSSCFGAAERRIPHRHLSRLARSGTVAWTGDSNAWSEAIACMHCCKAQANARGQTS